MATRARGLGGRIALAAMLAFGALLVAACSGDSASDGGDRPAERVGATSGFPTGPAVTVPGGYTSPGEHVPSTGAWVPDNGQPSLVFVDAIW